jgi:hypothetical protein
VQGQPSHRHGRRHVNFPVKDPTTPSSPASSAAPHTPQDRGSPPTFNLSYYQGFAGFGSLGAKEGKVMAVRQNLSSPQTELWSRATITEV